MTDVFISYSSSDRAVAQTVALGLQAQGLTVWWDRDIQPGRQFDQVIEAALDAAQCVVVLWSAQATESAWVRNEASEALRRDRLVPALIETNVRIPLEFRRVQAADLTGWLVTPNTVTAGTGGARSNAEWDAFCGAIKRLLGAGPGPTPPPPPRPPEPPPPQPQPQPPPTPPSKAKLWGWVGAGAVGAMLAASFNKPDPAPAPGPLITPVPSPAPSPSPAPQGAPATVLKGLGHRAENGFDVPLRWHDQALRYTGRLQWDGRSQGASLVGASAQDITTGRTVAQGNYNLRLLMEGPSRMVFTTEVWVPGGDSTNAAPHGHTVGLVFEQQAGGGWLYMRNCLGPQPSYPCFD
jgi:TIR domain